MRYTYNVRVYRGFQFTAEMTAYDISYCLL